ncbi:hypothetical protein [Hydrogenophaga sp.]|uniref:hypothetical protein n=1 Tax=Hydrogenophaga sp. TaxID=1904254 RepID=UPI00273186C9|nr:hypothetical protein [Hydrogenophaga sp.]MDP2017709.1 hypothetical protein [Hydrogenophaga sp.]MDP3167587.1 hypothetical protein [Hydrogenophaga sp.]MDP3810817.1 hypothetical protein [Hydrogenophaga sp.]
MNPPESSQQRLARSRAQVVQWLDHDRTQRDAFAHSGLGQLSALPWVRSIGNHPLASLALGALTKWWMQPRKARSSTAGVLAVGTGLGLLRRRPVLTVATVAVIGALAWWTQIRKRPPPPLN